MTTDDGQFETSIVTAQDAEKSYQELLIKDITAGKKAIQDLTYCGGHIQNLSASITELFGSFDYYKEIENIMQRIDASIDTLSLFLAADKGHDFHFIKEERKSAAKIQEEIDHKEWRLVKKSIQGQARKEVRRLAINIKNIKNILLGIKGLKNNIDDLGHSLILEGWPKSKQPLVDNVDKIMNAVLDFLGFYKNLFESMLTKERALRKKTKKRN